jgi:hypothetical protein
MFIIGISDFLINMYEKPHKESVGFQIACSYFLLRRRDFCLSMWIKIFEIGTVFVSQMSTEMMKIEPHAFRFSKSKGGPLLYQRYSHDTVPGYTSYADTRGLRFYCFLFATVPRSIVSLESTDWVLEIHALTLVRINYHSSLGYRNV